MSSLKQDQPIVLIVDSDPLMMTGMAAILHMQGYECHCARTAEAAEKAADLHDLDLILCDVQLKNASGLALCDRIHQQHGDDLPVVFLASTPQPEVMRRVEAMPNIYFLRKPFDPQLLIQMAENAIWFPHLVQSHLSIPVADSAPAAETEHAEPHRHASTPAPMRKSPVRSDSHRATSGPAARS